MYPGVRREGGLRDVLCRKKGDQEREAADAMTSRRGRLAVGIVLSALTVLLAMNGPNLWRWATTKTIPLGTTMRAGWHPWGTTYRLSVDPNVVRGWETVNRWSESPIYHGKGIGYWVNTGFKRIAFERRDGLQIVYWTGEGTVEFQLGFDESGQWHPKSAPPWWWNVKDQTEPTAPWWNEKDQ